MAVYVDPLRDYPPEMIKPGARRWGPSFCHMVADSREELDAMATAIGLRPAYRQHSGKPLEHYDLTPRRRELAIAKGAVALTGEEFRRLLTRRVAEWAEQRAREAANAS